jgi:hypothetical protein
LRFWRTRYLDDTHAAVAGITQGRVVAIMWNFDADIPRRVNDEASFVRLDLSPVQFELNSFGHGLSAF